MQTMQLQAKGRMEPAIAAGMWIGLWIGEALVSAQYWLTRALRRPLLVIAPVALGAGLSLYALAATRCDSMVKVASLDLKAIQNGVDQYRYDTGAYPERLEDLVPRYLKELHHDPWGNNYVFYRGAGGAAVLSAGPDKQLGSSDDIIAISPN